MYIKLDIQVPVTLVILNTKKEEELYLLKFKSLHKSKRMGLPYE